LLCSGGARLYKGKFEKPLIGIFFISFALVGLFSFKSYGISWDEAAQRLNGGTSLIYVVEKFAPSLVPEDKLDFPKLGDGGPTDHGVAFDAPLVALEQLLGINDPQSIYHLRHLANFLLFFLGTVGIFRLIKRRFNSYKLGLLGASFFIASPRFFAEGFYNNKDVIFACILTITLDSMFRYFENNSKKTLIFAGILTGLATNVRVAGIGLVPVFILGVIFLSLVRRENLKHQVQSIATYLIISISTIYVFFPWIWADPIPRFWQTLTSMSKYNWSGNVLYAGSELSALNLPWHYAFTWIGVTTPILYLLLALIGLFTVVFNLIKVKVTRKVELTLIQDSIMASVMLAPLLSIFILKPVLYDGWRHLYFVYPSLIFIAIVGWQKMFSTGKIFTRKALILITTFSLISTSFWMYENRPMQNLYFNTFAGEDLRNRWDFDYWGLGNLEALEYIVNNDSAEKVTVNALSFTPLFESTKMLDPISRSRIKIVDSQEDADYLLDNYRIPKTSIEISEKRNFALYKNFSIGTEVYLTLYKRTKQ
jgi:hypothetical protein